MSLEDDVRFQAYRANCLQVCVKMILRHLFRTSEDALCEECNILFKNCLRRISMHHAYLDAVREKKMQPIEELEVECDYVPTPDSTL